MYICSFPFPVYRSAKNCRNIKKQGCEKSGVEHVTYRLQSPISFWCDLTDITATNRGRKRPIPGVSYPCLLFVWSSPRDVLYCVFASLLLLLSVYLMCFMPRDNARLWYNFKILREKEYGGQIIFNWTQTFDLQNRAAYGWPQRRIVIIVTPGKPSFDAPRSPSWTAVPDLSPGTPRVDMWGGRTTVATSK